MKTYDYSMTTVSGEVYSCNRRFTSSWQFNGWDVYKNDNWLHYIPDVEFSIDGVNITIKRDEEAIRAAQNLERLEDEAERIFNGNHPELNP